MDSNYMNFNENIYATLIFVPNNFRWVGTHLFWVGPGPPGPPTRNGPALFHYKNKIKAMVCRPTELR